MDRKVMERARKVAAVERMLEGGTDRWLACKRVGVSVGWFKRWQGRLEREGLEGLRDRERSGRPLEVELNGEEREHLRRVYVRSNLRKGAGSMTLAARWSARDEESPLRPEVREAILRERSSKHVLPTDVRRAMRGLEGAVVNRYRDSRSGQNDGIYIPGWMRMAQDGEGRVMPNERWVGDDASVNVGVVVPWTRGGDRCSERWGVRLARFQLLAFIDCATDMCVGYGYVMRDTDAYRGEDVVSTLHRIGGRMGGLPREMVLEGGVWQGERLRGYLDVCGVEMISAKGRPNQKLVEGWFNRLWSVLSVSLPCGGRGQVGRFRGEMARENELWLKCRRGVVDPREWFPGVERFLGALDRAIGYLNGEVVESGEYGSWVPEVKYGEGQAELRSMPAGVERYALPVRVKRVVRRGGMVSVRAESVFGWRHEYVWAMAGGAEYDGAEVVVSFDPADVRRGAVIEMAREWRNVRAGTVLDGGAVCVSAAPLLEVGARGSWRAGWLDARETGREVKRVSRAKVRTQVAALDGRGKLVRDKKGEVRDTEELGREMEAGGAGRGQRVRWRMDEKERRELESEVLVG